MELTITDESSLLAACDWLHDDVFDLDSVSFDAGTGAWSIRLLRVGNDDPASHRVTRGLIFDHVSAPVFDSTLELAGVESFVVNDRSRIGQYAFNECRSQAGGYRFVFHEDMDFVIRFGLEPRGMLRDVGRTDSTETWRRLRQGS